MDNQSAGRWMASRTGMGGEVMEPILCHGSTQVYTYLQRELGRSQLGGAGEQYTLVQHHCVPGSLPLRHAGTTPPFPSLHRGSPRGGNATTEQQHCAQLK